MVNWLSVPVRAMEPDETMYIEVALEIKLGFLGDGWLKPITSTCHVFICSPTYLVDGCSALSYLVVHVLICLLIID